MTDKKKGGGKPRNREKKKTTPKKPKKKWKRKGIRGRPGEIKNGRDKVGNPETAKNNVRRSMR